MDITIKVFVFLLSQKDLSYGHVKGWLEDQDERFGNNLLDRRSAARIIHRYMKIELGIPDLEDISAANVLADLYTCRTCVNHIAQVYLRGIMEAQVVERDGVKYKIFNHLDEISLDESTNCLKRLFFQVMEKKGCS